MKQKKSKRRSELPEYQMSVAALRSRPLPSAAPLSLYLFLSPSLAPQTLPPPRSFPPPFTCGTLEELKVRLLTFLKAQTHTTARAWNKATAAFNSHICPPAWNLCFKPFFSQKARGTVFKCETHILIFSEMKTAQGANRTGVYLCFYQWGLV